MLLKNLKITNGGILAAITLISLMLASFLTNMTLAFLFISSAIMYLLLIRCGKRTFFLSYLAVSLLGLILVGDKRVIIYFILGFGYYPYLHEVFSRKNNILSYGIKGIYFAVMLAILYFVLKAFIPSAIDTEIPVVALGVAGIAALYIYDYLLSYIKPQLMRFKM